MGEKTKNEIYMGTLICHSTIFWVSYCFYLISKFQLYYIKPYHNYVTKIMGHGLKIHIYLYISKEFTFKNTIRCETMHDGFQSS